MATAPNIQASPVANHRARHAAQVTAMAKAAIEWADRPHDPFFRLRYLELAQLVTGADLSDDMDECRHELNIDEEGYPLDCNGYTICGRDREYIPPVVDFAS